MITIEKKISSLTRKSSITIGMSDTNNKPYKLTYVKYIYVLFFSFFFYIYKKRKNVKKKNHVEPGKYWL